jgi:hypothetical protein
MAPPRKHFSSFAAARVPNVSYVPLGRSTAHKQHDFSAWNLFDAVKNAER